MSAKITIDGQTYSSPDEMPPEVRAKHDRVMAMMADRDSNGVPDVLEKPGPPGQTNVGVINTSSRIVINGKAYGSLDDVPEGLRHLIDGALHGKSQTITRVSPQALGSSGVSWGGVLGGLIVGFILGCTAATVYWMMRGH